MESYEREAITVAKNTARNLPATVSKADKLAAARAARESAELALTAPAAVKSVPPPAPVLALTVELDPMDAPELAAPPAGESFDHSPPAADDDTDDGTEDSGAATLPAAPAGAPLPGITGPTAAVAWLRAQEAKEPGGKGTAAPWRHAGSGTIIRMGRVAIERCGVALDTPQHAKYNAERSTFWGLHRGALRLLPDGTVARPARTSSPPPAAGAPAGESSTATPTVHRDPRESAAHKLRGVAESLSAYADALIDHRAAPLTAGAVREAARLLELAAHSAESLPESWGVKPAAPPAPAVALVPGQKVIIPAGKLREACLAEGLIDAEDAGAVFTVRSVANEKVCVIIAPSGLRAQMFTRFLRPADGVGA